MRKVKIHVQKVSPEFFKDLGEIRLFDVVKDDEGFVVGDIVWLQEWSPENEYSGESKKLKITYILRDHIGIEKEYCVLGIAKMVDHAVRRF